MFCLPVATWHGYTALSVFISGIYFVMLHSGFYIDLCIMHNARPRASSIPFQSRPIRSLSGEARSQ